MAQSLRSRSRKNGERRSWCCTSSFARRKHATPAWPPVPTTGWARPSGNSTRFSSRTWRRRRARHRHDVALTQGRAHRIEQVLVALLFELAHVGEVERLDLLERAVRAHRLDDAA